MYIPISLTRLLLYFRKLTVLILLKSKLFFVVYFTYPYKRSMMQEVTQGNGIVWICFYTTVFFFPVLVWCECNDSTFGLSILTEFYMKYHVKSLLRLKDMVSMRRLQALVARMPCYCH